MMLISPEVLPHLWLMAAEALAFSALVFVLLRVRRFLGLAPLYVAIGSLQHLQMILASSIYVEVRPGVLINPGSAVLLTGTLFAVLVTYMADDAQGARRLIYGIVIANLALAVMSYLVGFHAGGPGARNLLEIPTEVFRQSLEVTLVGTGTLYFDVVLVILVFEALGRISPRSLFLRVWGALALVATFDTLLFVTVLFGGSENYLDILSAGITGKVLVAVIYAFALVIWTRVVDVDGSTETTTPIGDIFSALTYRQRYEEAQKQAMRDPLTGLFNRRWFDQQLAAQLASNQDTGLLMVDLDHFKSINDDYGHLVGDAVLAEVGAVVRSCTRDHDIPCRYGGEELGVILPATDLAEARAIAERLRESIATHFQAQGSPMPNRPVTVTVGVAVSRPETEGPHELLADADRRLYLGKDAGRNRVISTG